MATVDVSGLTTHLTHYRSYLGFLIHSTTQSPPDISRCNAITHAAMQIFR